MNNEKRAIIVTKSKMHPDGFIPIGCCGECPCIYRSCSVRDIKECGINSDTKIYFDEDHKIHDRCPLHFLSDIIPHPAEEIPKQENGKLANRDVLLKLRYIDGHADEHVVANYGVGDNGLDWLIYEETCQAGINRDIYNVISWTEILT